jgi:hypothetical protein
LPVPGAGVEPTFAGSGLTADAAQPQRREALKRESSV